MKQSLVSDLRCPITGSKVMLEEKSVASGEIISGILRNESGGEYPIDAGVPRMIAPDSIPPDQENTLSSFSEKWRLAPDYREKTKSHYVEWYLKRYGFAHLAQLRDFLKPFGRILDAGTGHGRDSELYARNSHGVVYGLDLSEGIHNAYRDLCGLENLHLVQGDLTRMPFPTGFFDFIACDQVLHHAPDTEAAFHHLVRHLAPAGHISIYVYKVKGPIREFCDDHIRSATVVMSVEECMAVAESITKFGKSLSDMKVEIDVPEDIPLLGITAGKHDLQRFIYWRIFKCYWNDTIDYESNVITNFDWYHPLHAHRHTPQEVRGWFADAGLEIMHFDIAESGISVIGRRTR